MIHQAGEMRNGLQCCSICGTILFRQDDKDPKKYFVPTRVVGIKNTTTQPVKITVKGWPVGQCLDVLAHKIEVTTKKPTCNSK